jgi:TRAP transporter TAXI family solute receptor
MRVYLAGLICLVLSACGPTEADNKSYILTTATTGGTYYPVGVAISTLVKLNLQEEHGISLSAINSAGSGENVKLLQSGEAGFALIQGLFGVWAQTGQGAYGQAGSELNLRSITMLWPNVEHFVVSKDHVKTGTMADLAGFDGEQFAVGNRNSGAKESNSMIFDALGIEKGRDIAWAYLGYGAAADALQNRTIGGFSAPAGAPVSAVVRAYSSVGDSITTLDISDAELVKINEDVDLWQRYIIPANTYPGQANPIRTAAQPNFLAVRADIDEDVVYRVTRVIFENLSFLYSVHKATQVMTLETAVEGLPVPLHPGAARFYREQGIPIPDNLLPPEMQPAVGGPDADE